MKTSSQRLTFTALMTLLATLGGTAFGLYELRGQADLFSDVFKISALIAVASVCLSFVFWTATHFRKDSAFRGGLAGLLTGLAIVQVPYFVSTLRAEFFRLHNSENMGVVMSALGALPVSLKSGLATYELITKVSLAAVLASVILGIIVAKTVPSRKR